MSDAICSVDGCDKPRRKREWCFMHYQRWLRHGEVGGAEKGAPPGRPKAWCTVEGCERKHYGNGYCSMHYQRWWRFGDPQTVKPNGMFKGDDVTYSGWHARLKAERGLARQHACGCGAPAVDWSYNGSCPDEKTGEQHGYPLAYCLHSEHYEPRCRLCHSRHDLNYPRRRATT